MKKIIYPANERGHNDIGWLKAKFSFSFGPYYNPDKIRFGALRVLNDDMIAGGGGFGSHPHDNMEIITIVLKGALEHKDSLGNTGVIQAGDVQVMSAGTGVLHSEYNPSATEQTNSLQIWLFPKILNVEPRYDQKSFAGLYKQNELTTLISPNAENGALTINQDSTFSMGNFDAGKEIYYDVKTKGNGAYIFVLDGSVNIEDAIVNKKDATGVYDTTSFTIKTSAQSQLLIIEVPMI